MDDVEQPFFSNRERDLMAEVARRLLPNLERVAESWAEAIDLDAPADKLPGMRQTLRGMTVPFLSSFFEQLSERNPQGALALYESFIESIIRGQLDEPERQRATIDALFSSARAVRGLLTQEIGAVLEGDEGRVAAVLPFNRLWSEAIESTGRIYVRLREGHLRQLYDDAQRTAEKLRESEERSRLLVEEAKEARDAALEASRMKSAFVANVTHEIHTPLNIILGYADLMAERLTELNDARASDYADPVRRAGKRLLDTVSSILEFSKIESGAYRIDPKPIVLGEFIERLLGEFRILAVKKGLALNAEIDEPRAVVSFDEGCLANVLTNLLQNAHQVHRTGGSRGAPMARRARGAVPGGARHRRGNRRELPAAGLRGLFAGKSWPHAQVRGRRPRPLAGQEISRTQRRGYRGREPEASGLDVHDSLRARRRRQTPDNGDRHRGNLRDADPGAARPSAVERISLAAGDRPRHHLGARRPRGDADGRDQRRPAAAGRAALQRRSRSAR